MAKKYINRTYLDEFWSWSIFQAFEEKQNELDVINKKEKKIDWIESRKSYRIAAEKKYQRKLIVPKYFIIAK